MTLPRLLLILTLPLYVLDQVTKFWTIATFPPPWRAPGESITVIENFFHLVRVHNQGVAFGFGNGTAWAPVVFLIVPLIALTLIRVFWKIASGNRLRKPGSWIIAPRLVSYGIRRLVS